MRVLVLLNQAAGTLARTDADDEPQRIRAGFAAAGVEARVESVEGRDLAARLAAFKDGKGGADGAFDAVIGGGGDGTLNTIAAALAGTGTAFGVLPLGTHNHFAKDLNVPLDLEAAVAALARGTTQDIDVAEVNGRLFLNFSAIGFHPLVVKHREAQRSARGRAKFLALFVAMWRVMRLLPLMRVTLAYGDTVVRRLTPSVIVCNNPHQMRVFGVEGISHHDRGLLNVYLARATRWYGLVWLIVRAALRRLGSASKFEVLVLPELTIDTRSRHARVSIDGEVTDLRTPLRYRVRRGGLKVIVPAAGAEGRSAGTDAPL
jgi:diacylglycerol kinase family enzyme